MLGRIVFGRWYNHVALYFSIWGISLLLFEARLINYYPLQPETWLVILAGSLAFLLGAVTPASTRWASGSDGPSPQPVLQTDSLVLNRDGERFLLVSLWIANIISFCAAMQHWYIVIKTFGSVTNALVMGNLLYSYRVSEGLPGSIPYLHSLAMTGAVLGGMYTAVKGTLKFVAIVPMIVMVLIETANMGRANMVIAAALFLGGYAMLRVRMPRRVTVVRFGKLKRVLAISVAVLVLGVGAESVRIARGSHEALPFATQTLNKFQGASFLTPSIYLYLTVHFGVLNQYLRQDVEHTPWGSNTFAPLYRILAKVGFNTPATWYQRFYKTPVGANTGSYLRELHADFGVLGILTVPYLIGLFSSIAWYRFLTHGRYLALIVAAYLGALVAMSIFVIGTRSGELLLSFLPSALVGVRLDRLQSRNFSVREAGMY